MWRAPGRRVVTTMTTHIFAGQTVHAPAVLTLTDPGALDAQLASLLAAGDHVLVVGGAAAEPDRLQGIAPEQVDRIAAHDRVDIVIVEGDGARRLPFKAPAAHEPVIPAATTLLIPVVGLDVIGKPLTPATVHRPALVARLTGAVEGDLVTPGMVATVLAHPDGGAKGLPAGARLAPFLNKADDAAALEQGARLRVVCSPGRKWIVSQSARWPGRSLSARCGRASAWSCWPAGMHNGSARSNSLRPGRAGRWSPTWPRRRWGARMSVA